MTKPCSIWIGFDPREVDAYAVARSSARRRMVAPIPIRPVILDDLRRRGLYRRETTVFQRIGRVDNLFDVISGAPMSTEFAISRFLVPYLAREGWALFMDADILVRENLSRLFDAADPLKAVMVVKHDHRPASTEKMDGQIQTAYARKNWSSVMLFNCDHPANAALTVDLINTAPGRDLHAFCWLKDDEIGELDQAWNWLAGHSDPEIEPNIVHFTDGVPSMRGCADAPYAGEWFDELRRWAA